MRQTGYYRIRLVYHPEFWLIAWYNESEDHWSFSFHTPTYKPHEVIEVDENMIPMPDDPVNVNDKTDQP